MNLLRSLRSAAEHSAVVGAVAILPLLGCGQEETPTPTLAPEQAGDEFMAEGTYAYRQVQYQNADSPTGGTIEQVTTAWSLGTIKPSDKEDYFIWHDTVCGMDTAPVYTMDFVIDEGFFVNETPPLEIYVSPTVGGSMSSDQFIELFGVTLDDPYNDALPTTPDDPRVYDYDYNDDPGYTIWVEGVPSGYIWAVQRYVYHLVGTSVSADGMTGEVIGYNELSSLYVSNEAIPISVSADFDPNAKLGVFEFVRVDEGMTCDQVLEQKDTLFTD